MFRSSSSSASVRGCCGATAAVEPAWVIVWVVVWVVIVVPVMLCEKSLFAIAKNGVEVAGVTDAEGSFSVVGLLRMVMSRGSGSVSDSLFHVCPHPHMKQRMVMSR